MMPRIRITELLHEVAQETGFLSAFTNLRTGELCPNENALLATILADATNLGLSRMAAASQGARDQLLWTHDAYIRDESYRAALAVLINAHHRLPFSRVWGDGTTSSSDGQFFRGAKRGASGGDINARYGVDHGFSFYTHVSDQRGPYHVNVISAATHEAPYVLDGLTAMAPISGSSSITPTPAERPIMSSPCARCWDFASARACATFRTGGLRRSRRFRPIRPSPRCWASVSAPTSSMNNGTTCCASWVDQGWPRRASVMLRKLAAYERQNQLDVALQEIGKIERTCSCWTGLKIPICAGDAMPA
nr:Tn3 family transposase [Sphingobium sp. LB126]